MPPKRQPDSMTLQELGIAEVDCSFDPDDLLDGPVNIGMDEDDDIQPADDFDLPIINDELLTSYSA